MILKFWCASDSCGEVVEIQISRPHPHSPEFLGWGPEMFISNKFLGDAHAGVPGDIL